MDFNEINFRLESMAVFRNLFDGEDALYHLKDLFEFYSDPELEIEGFNGNYTAFVSELYKQGGDLGKYIKQRLAEEENVFILKKSRGETVPECMENAVRTELKTLSMLSQLKKSDFPLPDESAAFLPDFDNTPFDFEAEYDNIIKDLSKNGYGIYAAHTMFKLGSNGEIMPVKTADKQRPEDLISYENERQQVIDNTLALINGKPAANLLLYGAAGTGKSSTVKAVANLLRSKGVRLIEIKKEQLLLLPNIMEAIESNPLKFIIFIDDLTFNGDEAGFGTLKAILEGSAGAKAENCVIYATSNRRHMVKESFSARSGDDVHREDTIQEQTSLSERFGKTILFDKPSKQRYIQIVITLAERAGLKIDESQIAMKAEAFALRKGGRSARTAKQFVDSLIVENFITERKKSNE